MTHRDTARRRAAGAGHKECPLPSSNCDDKLKPDVITASDIAYLKGVYKMDAGAKLQIQQDQIAGEMAAALGQGK